MSDEGYEKRTTYRFEAGGETWEICWFSDNFMEIIETSKNGQEDCHTAFDINLVDDHWVIDDVGRKRILENWWATTADEIQTFINKNGPPK